MNQKSRIVKLDPHFDQTKKLLVVGGRLLFAQIPEEAKHQIIIPHNNLEIDHAPSCQSLPCGSWDDSSHSLSTFLAHTRMTRSKASFGKMSDM